MFPDAERLTWFIQHVQQVIERCQRTATSVPGLTRPGEEHGAVFFPGTYSSGDDQGDGSFGIRPPEDDICELVGLVRMVADCNEAQAARFLQEQIGRISIIKRLDLGMQAIPIDEQTGLSCNTPEDWAACNFHDGLRPMGAVAVSSVLRFRAARDMAHLAALLGEDELAAKYCSHAQRIAESVQQLLLMPSGWIMAASEVNRQPDVWATSYAVYEGLLTGQEGRAAAEAMLEAYRQGTVSAFGYLRHTPTTADAVPGKHVWEHLDSVGQGAYGTYQNGGYWPQPVGFYAFAIAQIDRETAALPLEGFRRLSTEYATGESPH